MTDRTGTQIMFNVSIPGKPHLKFLWMIAGIEQARIGEDDVLHLAAGITAEDALRAAAEAFGGVALPKLGNVQGSVVISQGQKGGVTAHTIVNR